jgi:hypothetical protein
VGPVCHNGWWPYRSLTIITPRSRRLSPCAAIPSSSSNFHTHVRSLHPLPALHACRQPPSPLLLAVFVRARCLLYDLGFGPHRGFRPSTAAGARWRPYGSAQGTDSPPQPLVDDPSLAVVRNPSISPICYYFVRIWDDFVTGFCELCYD